MFQECFIEILFCTALIVATQAEGRVVCSIISYEILAYCQFKYIEFLWSGLSLHEGYEKKIVIFKGLFPQKWFNFATKCIISVLQSPLGWLWTFVIPTHPINELQKKTFEVWMNEWNIFQQNKHTYYNTNDIGPNNKNACSMFNILIQRLKVNCLTFRHL